MRLIGKYLILIAVIVAGSAFATNAQSYTAERSATSRRSMDDEIFRRINRLPNYGVFDHITYQIKGSTVVLDGKVWSLGTSKAAERVVKRIAGVERVINNIDDLPPSSWDNSIRYRVLREFARSPGLYPYLREPNPSVRIIVERGRVTLEGYVNSRSTANTMYILANGVSGTFGVTNNLIVDKERVR